MDFDQKFWSKVEATGFCWNWTGAEQKGYGKVRRNKKTLRVHRYAYEMLIEPLPEDMTVDHLCRNTLCVNPDHMEIVTNEENLRRSHVHRTSYDMTAAHAARGY